MLKLHISLFISVLTSDAETAFIFLILLPHEKECSLLLKWKIKITRVSHRKFFLV